MQSDAVGPAWLRSAFGFQLVGKMKHQLIALSAAIALAGLAIGCDSFLRFSDSGIPTSLESDELLRAAGASQGLSLSPVGTHGSGATGSGVGAEREFNATISSGTRGQLLAAYRDRVRQVIEGKGGEINESGVIGSPNDVCHFSYGYRWSSHVGVVRVYSFQGTNGQVQVISFCYEHRK